MLALDDLSITIFSVQDQINYAKALILIYEFLKENINYTNLIFLQCLSKRSVFQTQDQERAQARIQQDLSCWRVLFPSLFFLGTSCLPHEVWGPERSGQSLSVSSSRSQFFWAVGRGTMEGHLPVVEQEEAGGQGDSELQPAPVRDGVGDGIEHQEPDGESSLVEDPHCPPVLRAHHFCHCKCARGQVRNGVPHTHKPAGGTR